MAGALSLLLFISGFSAFSACPLGWTPLLESCYLVSPDISNWYEAQVFCWDQGGYLAELADGDEYDLLNTYMLQTDQSYWIGLTDEAQEGTWRWAESHQTPTWTNWSSGNPDNGHGNEDCVYMWSKTEHKWNDDGCNDRQAHGLCETAA
eukprot:TRINITY_DN1794_c0_g1_i6.p1 TRINITY_DN1794_c0_g1~~TRINITY_DN1794_c0_g1_i6.p1  ORF type:complete len:149 (-),score=9.90 TRINITY_DN1794_c0_g1_i6:9-455(-)